MELKRAKVEEIVASLTDYHIVQRSYKGTGFDYWLGLKKDPLFQNAARLEVWRLSGSDRVRIYFAETQRSRGPARRTRTPKNPIK